MVPPFENIGIIQHAGFSDRGYKLIHSEENYGYIDNVEDRDPELSSWTGFVRFIKTVFNITFTPTSMDTYTLDLMACALYSDPNWRYIIDKMSHENQITIRASLDNTGAASLGGNWILEASSSAAAAFDTIDLTTVYFTEDITKWNYILVTTPSPVLLFDGIDDYVTIGTPSWCNELQFRQTMTVECWFKTPSASLQPRTFPSLVSRNYGGGASISSQFHMGMLGTFVPADNGMVFFGVTSGSSNTSLYINSSPTKYNDGNWHHIAATYTSSTGTVSLYVDGVFVNSATNANIGATSATHSPTIPIFIGSDAGQTIQSATDRNFQGSISDVRIWNVVRSAADISNNYRRRLIGNETGLVGYLELNHGNGTGWGSYTVALDNTSNRAHGTLTNFASPSSNWTLSTLYFTPRISSLVLGANNGSYLLSDASFSFVDPSSNSMGAFTYSIDSSAVTLSNGAATTKTVYATSGAITIPTLTIYEFPEIASLTDWQIDISFTVTGGAGSLRAVLGDMYNNINTRGWGIWVSSSNRIHWSWLANTSEPSTITVALNTPYVLTVAQSVATSTNTFTTTSLLARYDTSQASNYTLSGGVVTQWNDLTGNGYHLIPNGTGPTLTTINSVTAFDFNSGKGFIKTSVPLSSSITVFMVIKYSTNIGNWGSFMHHGHRDTDWAIERNSWYTAMTSHNIQFQSNNVNGPPELSTTNNVNYILIGRISGSTREFWRYSDTEALGFATGSSVSIATGNKTIYVGKSENNEVCNSTIGEILYYN